MIDTRCSPTYVAQKLCLVFTSGSGNISYKWEQWGGSTMGVEASIGCYRVVGVFNRAGSSGNGFLFWFLFEFWLLWFSTGISDVFSVRFWRTSFSSPSFLILWMNLQGWTQHCIQWILHVFEANKFGSLLIHCHSQQNSLLMLIYQVFQHCWASHRLQHQNVEYQQGLASSQLPSCMGFFHKAHMLASG